jgi:hypothetical protein
MQQDVDTFVVDGAHEVFAADALAQSPPAKPDVSQSDMS